MKTRVKNLARAGKTVRVWVRNVRVQDGSCGWRRAQEREVMDGWAAEVMGAMAVRAGGRVGLVGKRMGEMKALLYRWLADDVNG